MYFKPTNSVQLRISSHFSIVMSQLSIAVFFDFKLTCAHFTVFNLQHKPLICLMIFGVKKPKCVSIKETVGDAKLRNGLQGYMRRYSD
jgi:hypothetical protein